jgi:cytochrome c-type biogenesis protein CcmE
MLVGATIVAALIGWYGWSQVDDGVFTYYQTLREFQAEGVVGTSVRVHGYVAEGTIERDVEGKQVHFAVQDVAPHAGGTAAGAMPVVYASLETPDLFKDGAEVVVEGKLRSDGSFAATNLLAKCPSKFEAAQEEGAARPNAG